MTALMLITMLPSLVFSESVLPELGGELKLNGELIVGSKLTAKYDKVTPENVTDDDEFAAEKEKFLSVLRNAVIDAEKSNSLDTLHDIMKFTKEKIEI